MTTDSSTLLGTGAGGTRRPVFVAAVGDSNHVSTWSGIPFHFLAAARRAGFADAGLSLEVQGLDWRVARMAWNATQVLFGNRPGGYQYSIGFLERMWEQSRQKVIGGIVINMFALFPPSLVAEPRVEKWFFLDMTLRQLFDHYGLLSEIGKGIAKEALAREKEGYQRAKGIIGHSRWAANSVIHDYGVDPGKVHVALPGANLDADEYARWEAQVDMTEARNHPLRLVFVGKDWRRKGLDRLLRGLQQARAGGSKATLRVIGCPRDALPADLAAVGGVEWYGFVDKRSQAHHFLKAVAECDVGCLLSQAEAGGISLREYHALGLAVIGTEAGGSPEHALSGASILIPVEAGDAHVADVIASLEHDRPRLDRLRRFAWENRRQVSWEATVERVRSWIGP